MLGNVARKLRIFGFDTLYVAHVDDSEVLKIGVDQDRIILTADKEFFKRIVKARAKGVLVESSNELDDLVHILEKNGIRSVGVSGNGSRCSMCNGLLARMLVEDARKDLPENVALNHSVFFRCASCGKIFWEGSHIRHIRELAKNINALLAKQ